MKETENEKRVKEQLSTLTDITLLEDILPNTVGGSIIIVTTQEIERLMSVIIPKEFSDTGIPLIYMAKDDSKSPYVGNLFIPLMDDQQITKTIPKGTTLKCKPSYYGK